MRVDKSVQLKVVPSDKVQEIRIDGNKVLDDTYILKEYLKAKGVKVSSTDGKRLLILGKALIKEGAVQ